MAATMLYQRAAKQIKSILGGLLTTTSQRLVARNAPLLDLGRELNREGDGCKKLLKSEFAFKLLRSCNSISFNLANVDQFFLDLDSKGLCLCHRKRKKTYSFAQFINKT